MMSGADKCLRLYANRTPAWMGILNVTPDSFSDGGKFCSVESAVSRAVTLCQHGASAIDVGGASSRPGSQTLNPEEELIRVLPVLEKLRTVLPPSVLISVDSHSPVVCERLARDGLIDLINDIYAGRRTEKSNGRIISTLNIAREFGLGIVLMHMQNSPETMQNNPVYSDCRREVVGFLKERADVARSEGIRFVALDPGIGFGKTTQNNLELVSREACEDLVSIGLPVLVGLSRKRFLGELDKDLVLPQSRDLLSKTFEFKCVSAGVWMIRSHLMPSEVFPV